MAAKPSKTEGGARFGHWTVIARVDRNHVECHCQCGTRRVIHRSNLTSGKTRSCGCATGAHIAVAMTRHGQFGTSIYRTWSSMLTRCENPRSRSFKDYGGRGIRVCERWHVFENFFSDMGLKPSPRHSIDRIDVNGNYEPGNCRWATASEQARNKRPRVYG